MPVARNLRGWVLTVSLLCMAVGNCYLLWRARDGMAKGYFDFANFYTAGTLVYRGLGAELYNAPAEWRVQQEFSSEVKQRRGPMRYLRPPFEAVLFSLFARWPYPKALLIWTVFQIALLSAIPFIVVHNRPWSEVFPLWVTPLLILGTFPAFIDLLLGQDALLLAFLYAICFRQLDDGRDIGAGIVLGLALLKFQFALPLVIMLCIAGRTRILSGFAVSASILTVLSGAIVGWKALWGYPSYLLTFNRTTGVGIAPSLQITFRGLLTLIVGRAPYPGRIHWLLAPVAIAAIVYAGLLWRRAGRPFLAEGFGLAAVVAIVTSYYAYSYDLLLLLAPLLAMRTRRGGLPETDRLTRFLEKSGLLLLLLTPVFWLVKEPYQLECLMALPLIAVGVALARRLRSASVGTGSHPAQLASVPA